MNRYYISVAGWNGAGVTAPCIIIGQEFEAETEREAGEAAEKSADEQFPGYAPFAVIRSFVMKIMCRAVDLKEPEEVMEPTIYACHPCRDGSYGVADFRGFKFNDKENAE